MNGWPEDLQELFDANGLTPMAEEFVATLAKTIGESPEAWRGVEALADQLLRSIAAGRDFSVEQGYTDASPLLLAVTAMASAASMHPLAHGANKRHREATRGL